MKDEVKATLASPAVAQLCLFRPMRLVCIALLVAAAMSGCAQIQGVFRNSDPLPARISLRDRTGASYNEFTLAPGEIRQSPLFPGSITLAERGKHIDDVHVVFWHIREHYFDWQRRLFYYDVVQHLLFLVEPARARSWSSHPIALTNQ